jgi:hypothetical protein
MKKVFLAVFGLFVMVFATDVEISNGNLATSRTTQQMTAMMQGWYDTRVITVGTSNVVVSTTYTRMVCSQIRNESDSSGVIYYSTQVQPDSASKKAIHLAAGENSGLLPPISKIWNMAAGSDSLTLTLFFHKF